ncbi:MAG: hypothetical protein ACOYJB_08745 [Christensenellaceae bacterium]|jgi:hypothetical protein
MDMKRFNLFAGNYGSGKTELSLNMALQLKNCGKTALVDMDIVNPYFRSSESKEMLEEEGIRVISPPFANTTVDVPALSAEVYSAFKSEYAVFDAGGDPVGATALGGYKKFFKDVEPDFMFYYVINARRPFQRSIEDAQEMLYQIQNNSRLTIHALVNNTNVAGETTVQDLVHGYEFCMELGKNTGIPLAFTSGTPALIDEFSKLGYAGEVFPIKIFTRPQWL